MRFALALALVALALIILSNGIQGTHSASLASSGAVTKCYPWQGYYSLSYGGWVHLAPGSCIVSTQVSAGGNSQSVNFTSGACGSAFNTAWTIGFGFSKTANGNFTGICSTLFTSTDVSFGISGSSGQTFTGNVIYPSMSFVTGTPYSYTSGITALTAPSVGYSSAVDFDSGGLPNGLSIFSMSGCYVTTGPAWDASLNQLSFTAVQAGTSSQCTVQVSVGSYGAAYYMQSQGNTYAEGNDWTQSGSVLTISVPFVGPILLSFTPLTTSPSPSQGGPKSTQTVTVTYTNSTTVTTSVQTSVSAPTAGEILGSQYLVVLIGGIGLTFVGSAQAYARNKKLAVAVGATGGYLVLDLLAWVNGFAISVNQFLPVPVFVNFGLFLSPVEAWLQSLGSGIGVVALALIFVILGALPFLGPAVKAKLDEVS